MRRPNARRTPDPSNKNNDDEKDNDNTSQMDSLKVHFRQNPPHRSTNLFTSHRNPKNPKSNIVVFVSIAIILALFLYIVASIVRQRNSVNQKFGIVIDGGSTGTRIHVFRYQINNGVPLFDFSANGLASMRVNPGLSAYERDPAGAGESLADLLEFGKRIVPKDYWRETEIRLMATAGMRLLEVGVQNQILESCRRVLRFSGFKFRDHWASVISGSDEGLYAWVVANYALGTLGTDPLQTTGIIELGGASAQVTFVTSEPIPPEVSHRVKFGNFTYNLYSHSLLHFGQNVAFDLLQESLMTTTSPDLATESLQRGKTDPCTPKGYTRGSESLKLSPSTWAEKSRYMSSLQPSGNFSECRSASLMLLQKDKEKCTYKRCYIGSSFIPRLQGKFLATENFFHTSKFFGLAPKAFLADMAVAGEQFCQEDWSVLRGRYHSLDEDDLRRVCFSSAYIVALLHDSLGISLTDERIVYANQVQNIPLDWALGAFILQTAADSRFEYSNWIATILSTYSSTLLALIGLSFLLMFTAWTLSKCRKPQLKTIYDLEKGKYIITRVGRYS